MIRAIESFFERHPGGSIIVWLVLVVLNTVLGGERIAAALLGLWFVLYVLFLAIAALCAFAGGGKGDDQ